jgi:hypothetical protein
MAHAGSGPAPQTFIQTIPGSNAKFKMVRIPDGAVTINGRRVTIKNLWVSETEVTWNVMDVWVFKQDMSQSDIAKGVDAKSRPSPPYGAPDRGYGHSGYAAISVHANSAQNFVRWLSAKTGKAFRLPTEAEWQYAAGPAPANLDAVAWHDDNADGKTHPVKKKGPNAFGLYDMFGNAGEWVIGSGGELVLAGGSFLDSPKKIGPTTRARYSIKWQERDPQKPKSKWWLSDGPFAGMRVVMTGP